MNYKCLLRLGALISASAVIAFPAVATESVWQDPVSGIRFVAIPKGCFNMGRDADLHPPFDSYWQNIGYTRPVNADEKPAHQACVDAFWMGAHEVTQAQWSRVMGVPAAADKRLANKARGGVSFSEAETFVERMNAQTGGKKVFRLPTEAEWEYACRSGGKDEDQTREMLAKHAWFAVDYIERAKPRTVGELKANSFGLHDMLGNVWEWTQDAYQANAYQNHALYNPRVAPAVPADPRVIRGGSLRSEAVIVRCSKRGRMGPSESLPLTGLRIVREKAD